MNRSLLCALLALVLVTCASESQARWYKPELGRWTRRDPKAYSDGPSLFAYVRSRPIALRDPRGLSATDCAYCANWAAANDPLVKSLLQAIAATACGPIDLAATCSQGTCGAERGHTIPGPPPAICVNPGKHTYPQGTDEERCSDVVQTFRHELLHAFDYCKPSKPVTVPDEPGTICELTACREVRACMYSGQCQPGGFNNPDGALDPVQCCIDFATGPAYCPQGPPPSHDFLAQCADLSSPPGTFPVVPIFPPWADPKPPHDGCLNPECYPVGIPSIGAQ